MMKSGGGYYPSNPHTKNLVLGCGLAFLVFALFALLLMTTGMGC